jgi:hypothetical protein
VSNRCLRPLAAFLAIVSLGIPCRSQSSEVSTINGELHSDALLTFHEYLVELTDVNHFNDTHRVDVRFDGAAARGGALVIEARELDRVAFVRVDAEAVGARARHPPHR